MRAQLAEEQNLRVALDPGELRGPFQWWGCQGIGPAEGIAFGRALWATT